ncbi:MAG: DUF3147 family protein [Alphaproteobacteria bacterium]|nr:DUF3147 family protein [Alphaproteobacteria bacterium]
MATFFSGYFLMKILITALIVVGVSELAKHYSLFAAVLASLPLTSILAFIWMHVDGQSNAEVAALSKEVFWLVIPSLLFFIVFPMMLRLNVAFFVALLISIAATALAYGAMLKIFAISSKAA